MGEELDRGYGSRGARGFLWRAQSFPLAAPALAAPEEFLWRRQTGLLWRRQSVSLAAPNAPPLAAPKPTPLAVPGPGICQQNASLPAPETAPLWRLQRNSSGGARGPPSGDARGIPLAAPNELPLVAPEGRPLAAPEASRGRRQRGHLWRRQSFSLAAPEGFLWRRPKSASGGGRGISLAAPASLVRQEQVTDDR